MNVEKTVRPEAMQFRVSSGLKRVLGRELITNDEVAIFELVKNSFDAGARNVYVHFDVDAITVADDGCGMSLDDLRDKWLFVAYSSKRDVNRNYRDEVSDRQHYAGSKGIGRFSSDRLGQELVVQTRPRGGGLVVHRLNVDWSKFEEDDERQFGKINVDYEPNDSFDLPKEIPSFESGTVLQIKRLTKSWSQVELRKLKAGLAKLINPFGSSVDGFKITMLAPQYAADDDALSRKAQKQPHEAQEAMLSLVVNGPVGNFIFSTLKEKTTYLDVSIDPNTRLIETTLVDRGELIFKVREKGDYSYVAEAQFRCQLYYLNRAAKSTFARRMGLQSTQFGSVFLFRNGFRVFPIGDDGDDWFGINRRKQQGYARFLGTREIIGRIDVSGGEDLFQEASSRNQGLIETPAVTELRRCFREQCLKRLERYVVPVNWAFKADTDNDTLALIETDGGRARVAAVVADLIGGDDIELVEYNTKLIDIINERSEQFESTLASLRLIAETTHDDALAKKIVEAEARFEELKRSEAEARRIADEERKAKREAEARAAKAEAAFEAVKEELGEQKKRNLFLASISTLDKDTILNMHHQITMYAADVQQQIENLFLRMGDTDLVRRDLVVERLEPIALLNRKVLAVSKFATKANFRLESEYISEDLSAYVVQYIEQVAREFLSGTIKVFVGSDGKPFDKKFKPIDVSIVVDNLVSNARRAKAKKIHFTVSQPRKNVLEIFVQDDGRGISPAAAKDGQLFEKGFTTTTGSGLGLYHVRQVLGEMGGTIEMAQADNGAAFLIRVSA